MKHQQRLLRSFSYYTFFVCSGAIMLIYLFQVSAFFYASKQYQRVQRFSTNDADTNQLKRAMWFDANNAEYPFTLAGILLQKIAKSQEKPDSSQFDEAASWLHRAILLNPTNPWYYYELGRLHEQELPCADLLQKTSGAHWQTCPASRYFFQALRLSPGQVFLRKTLGLWTYTHDQHKAFQLIKDVITEDPRLTSTLLAGVWPQIQDYSTLQQFLPAGPEAAFEFSKFLYDHQRDYESDRELAKALQTQQASFSCSSPNLVRQSADLSEIEIGNDDGSAEWRTYLASDTVRVKKTFCLPSASDQYTNAAVKIFMNSGTPGDFIAYVSIDDHIIREYLPRTIPYKATWIEIPFDPKVLAGKTMIHVYIRVADASASGNYLQVWGDQDTPRTHSVFNFETSDDLSFDQGIQQGEYMIRLVLRKS